MGEKEGRLAEERDLRPVEGDEADGGGGDGGGEEGGDELEEEGGFDRVGQVVVGAGVDGVADNPLSLFSCFCLNLGKFLWKVGFWPH